MTTGARANRAEANEDLTYNISTLQSNGKVLLGKMKESQGGKGVSESLIATGESHPKLAQNLTHPSFLTSDRRT